MPDGPTLEELAGAVAEMDAAVAAARSDVLVAAGPFALAVLGWAMIRRKRRRMAEHLAAIDAIVAESHDVPGPETGTSPGPFAAAENGAGAENAAGDELVDVDALAEMYGRSEPGV